jgi:hypothetical protein
LIDAGLGKVANQYVFLAKAVRKLGCIMGAMANK